ncbi:MAG: hypothetical protein AABY79_11175 [Nitrospirota bacterium]
MTRIVIVIPSYIKADNPKDCIESDGFKMLERAMASLKSQKDFDVTVALPFCIEGKGMKEGRCAEYHSALMKALSANPFPFKRFVLTDHNFNIMKEGITKKGFYDIYLIKRLALCGFSNIRNSGLIISQALNADVVVFIDNDEVVEDTNFLDIALEGLFEPINNKIMDGKGGFYISADEKLYERLPYQGWQVFWNKSRLFKELWEDIINTEGRFVESPVVLGGNLVITRRLFEKIPFDPLIPRGEDIDYLINAKIANFNILFDKMLRIKHLPKERAFSYRKEELKGDIERFLYEKEKVSNYKWLNLNPYPGYFIKWDIEIKALITVILFSLRLILNKRWRDAVEVYGYLTPLFKKAKDRGYYEDFKLRWTDLMVFIKHNNLNDLLREGFL